MALVIAAILAKPLAAWQAVLQLATKLDPIPEALVPVLAEGQRFSNACSLRIEQQIAETLGDFSSRMEQPSSRQARAFVDAALGKRRIYANGCNGLCYPFLPADEFFDDNHFPWFADVEARTALIREEMLALLADPGDALRPYVRLEKGSPQSKWSPLDQSLARGGRAFYGNMAGPTQRCWTAARTPQPRSPTSRRAAFPVARRPLFSPSSNRARAYRRTPA